MVKARVTSMIDNVVITTQIGGYLLDFKDAGILIKVGQLDVHKDGRVTGFLTIYSSGEGEKVIKLPKSTFNFSADKTRGMTAKALELKYPDDKVNWVEVFDYLGEKMQELARQGEPVIEVWAEDDVKAPEFLLEPFIYKNQSNIIFGEKGTLKSSLSQAMAMCMALPWPDNPLGLTVPDKPVVSLYLDWETDKKIFEWSLSRLKRGMGMPTIPVQYRRCYLPLAEELEEIEQYIDKVKATVLFIDSLAAAASGDKGELDSKSALSFNMALRKLNRTSFIIAQTSKAPDGKKTILGSTLFTYYSRNIFEICRSEDGDNDKVHSAIFHRECNLGRKHQPMGFCMDFNDANRSLNITRESVTVSEFIGKVTSQSAVYDALKSGMKSVKELAEETGLKENNVRTSLGRLSSKVVKVGNQWGLKSHHVDEMPFK